ncbi:hypothetical protein [Desulfonatronum sp. SC1]|uniref:hypothetical protein n=1 Tax=Desulfonatronum sp. SC1 TaxID=2109626 RepID=UPI001304D7BC|nr:hypothetical protein [Desulfonatronum sp. SC1]
MIQNAMDKLQTDSADTAQRSRPSRGHRRETAARGWQENTGMVFKSAKGEVARRRGAWWHGSMQCLAKSMLNHEEKEESNFSKRPGIA